MPPRLPHIDPGSWFAHASSTARHNRPTRVQIAALVLLTVFSLGPVVALVIVLQADADPVSVLAEVPPDLPDDAARVNVTIASVSPVLGEMRTRLLLVPPEQLRDGGRLTEPLTMLVNDARGQTIVNFVEGQTPGPVEVTLALGGGSVNRYPFDQYRSDLLLVISRDRVVDGLAAASDGRDEDIFTGAVPTVVQLTTSLADFSFSVTPPDPESLAVRMGIDLQRSTATTVYATGIMILMWGLAITGVLIAWAVVTWGVEAPFWVYAYLVGILFALTPLREALPGRPPPGTLVDYVAFYWSVSILGTTLLLLVLLWIRRSRPAHLPSESHDLLGSSATVPTPPDRAEDRLSD